MFRAPASQRFHRRNDVRADQAPEPGGAGRLVGRPFPVGQAVARGVPPLLDGGLVDLQYPNLGDWVSRRIRG